MQLAVKGCNIPHPTGSWSLNFPPLSTRGTPRQPYAGRDGFLSIFPLKLPTIVVRNLGEIGAVEQPSKWIVQWKTFMLPWTHWKSRAPGATTAPTVARSPVVCSARKTAPTAAEDPNSTAARNTSYSARLTARCSDARYTVAPDTTHSARRTARTLEEQATKKAKVEAVDHEVYPSGQLCSLQLRSICTYSGARGEAGRQLVSQQQRRN